MKRDEIEGVMAALPPELGFLKQGMAARVNDVFARDSVPGVFSFAVEGRDMTPAVYDFFRYSDWLLLSLPDKFLGAGKERASLRKKRYVTQPVTVCYHATPAENRAGFQERGLLPGYKVNKGGRGAMFKDSPYYIFVSPTANHAIDWCERFGQPGKYLIYPVHLANSPTPIRVFADPLSVNTHTGSIEGFILETDEIEPGLLGQPQEIEVT
jgi:hypothetical protein